MTERLRSEGDNETYIIMLTVLDDASSHERGYFAGVDDYLSKRAPDAKIVMAIRAAFKAVEMRRALRAAKEQSDGGAIGDTTRGVLIDRMRAEVKRAARYSRDLSILVLQLEAESGASVADVMARAMQVVAERVRTDIDFVGRYRGIDGVQRIAVILPETPRAVALQVGSRLCAALAQNLQTPLETFTARVGCTGFTPGKQPQPSAETADKLQSLLREAEAAVRVPPASTAPAAV
jgi:PleD family two-component response regulator